MNTKSWRTQILAGLGMLLPQLSMAQTTGSIEGTVTNDRGRGLTGVAVTISSLSLQGTRTAATDSSGQFRMLANPPGSYLLEAELDGFNALGVSRGLDLQLIADVFNLTNEQQTAGVDQTWTLAAAERTEDPNTCGGPDAGPNCPEGNPLFGSPISFRSPRVVRAGAKRSW